jgi:hypothetical protein
VNETPDRVRRLKGGTVDENKTPSGSETDEVEGHGLTERPGAERPSAEAMSEEPDVEGHGYFEKPSAERPSAE